MTNAEVAERFDVLPLDGLTSYQGQSSLAGLTNPGDDGRWNWTPEVKRFRQNKKNRERAEWIARKLSPEKQQQIAAIAMTGRLPGSIARMFHVPERAVKRCVLLCGERAAGVMR